MVEALGFTSSCMKEKGVKDDSKLFDLGKKMDKMAIY